MKVWNLKFVIWYLVVDDLLPFISFYVKTYILYKDFLTYVINYNYLYIFYLFLFTESRILLFMIQIYDSIYETLPTIQGKIPILTTMLIFIKRNFKHLWYWYNIFLSYPDRNTSYIIMIILIQCINIILLSLLCLFKSILSVMLQNLISVCVLSPTSGIYWVELGVINNCKEPQL